MVLLYPQTLTELVLVEICHLTHSQKPPTLRSQPLPRPAFINLRTPRTRDTPIVKRRRISIRDLLNSDMGNDTADDACDLAGGCHVNGENRVIKLPGGVLPNIPQSDSNVSPSTDI